MSAPAANLLLDALLLVVIAALAMIWDQLDRLNGLVRSCLQDRSATRVDVTADPPQIRTDHVATS